MTYYFITLLFIIGLVMGSFYNVVGLRLPNKESIIFPGSHCPDCGYKLKWYQNIPLFSFAFLKGKCSSCQKKISFIYPIMELITGITFVVSYLVFDFSLMFAVSIILSSALIIVTVSDLKYMIILDEILIISVVLIIILYLFMFPFKEVGLKILNGILSFGIMFLIKLLGDLIFKKESMGGGDIKLMGLVGLVLNFQLSIVVIFLSSFLALPVASYFLYRKKEHILPYGPFLCLATLILFMTQVEIKQIVDFVLNWY